MNAAFKVVPGRTLSGGQQYFNRIETVNRVSGTGLDCANQSGGVFTIADFVLAQSRIDTICPSNSTLKSGSCICNAGYAPNGSSANACVQVVTQPDTEKPDWCTPASGNPIYPVRGTKRETVAAGIRLAGLELQLTYDTARRAPRTVAGTDLPDAQTRSFGELWSSTFHRRLVLEPAGLGARLLRGDGTTISFSGNGGGAFTPDASTNDRLIKDGSVYRFVDASARAFERYDALGALQERKLASGQWLAFSYSDINTPITIAPGIGYLIGVSDSFGRSIAIEYTLAAGADPATAGRISRVTDPNGQIVQFDYAGQNLNKVKWQDLSERQFLYENTSFSWALTGVVAESLSRLSTFGYDASGRALSTEYAGGVARYSASYTGAPAIAVADTYDPVANVVRRKLSWQAPVAPAILQPNGSTLSLSVSMVAGNPAVTSRSQPAGSGCAASSSAMSYDANGNVSGSDDFNGSRMCAVNDLSRNLQTTRVAGLANTQACSAVTPLGATLPAGGRKSSTQWHADWRLQTKVAEPGRIVTSIYNGQPDPFNAGAVAACAPASAMLPDGKPIAVLCKQVEQATTDGNGAQGFSASLQTGVAPRVQSWTYNPYGQVLTTTDALNHTTSSAYYSDTTAEHTQGDLQTVTNALGHVTRYTRYDRSGRLLQMQAANGVLTDYSHDPRGRLRTVTTTGLTTQYDYTPSGQLLRVTQPDGSYLLHEYDAAERLVAMSNQLGQRIEYTLDASGNRIGENLRDGDGTLRRAIARSIDALNRVFQVIGRE